jgi:uncharacterized protein YyaL (SSP411 family)
MPSVKGGNMRVVVRLMLTCVGISLGLGILFGAARVTCAEFRVGTMERTEKERKITKGHNRLIFEKSPYLLQHADNPVDWYPWGPEAFEKARKEDKPIFLSIGYSTCHWCHVMEHESFEDARVATLMNEVFVSIKVDREERPDLDNIYMTVCQMMTGSGGWPLTVIMTPDKKPFFAGTYFPRESRHGRIGMLDLIPRVREIWTTRRDEVVNSADQITASLRKISAGMQGEDLGEPILKTTFNQLAQRFDQHHGGFGNAPKFPTPHNLLFLLRYWRRSGDEEALRMVEKTLQALRRGGIYDHVGFGFHRYSTDPLWLVPHFEKMLYDQALLAMAYTEAYQATRREDYARTAREIFTYVLRDMRASEGGYYSAEDAESEGEEGKFYLWTEDEIRDVLPTKESDLVITVFNVAKQGNFREEASGKQGGRNILHLKGELHEIVSDLNMSEPQLRKHLEKAREKLFAAREKRVHPHRDDKILTDWNGLVIAALAKGARALDEPQYTEAAEQALDFILMNMRNSQGRLFHRYRDGEAAVPAYVDDYAFLIWGMLELYETTFNVQYLRTALDLNNVLLKHFWDDKAGALYFTADDSEKLLVRQKDIYDGAIPSGNSVAALNLLRLGRMTGNATLEEKAVQIGRAFSGAVRQSPPAYTQLMLAVDFAVGPSYEVVIAGKPGAEDTEAMIRALRNHFLPNKVVLFRPGQEESPDIKRLAQYTKYQTSIDGQATAYVCLNYNCTLPTTDPKKMLELLDVKKP